MKTSYKITLGTWSVDKNSEPNTELTGVHIQSRLNHIDRAVVRTYINAGAPVEPLSQPIGAAQDAIPVVGDIGGPAGAGFSKVVRRNEIKAGDAVSISLTAGDVSEVVFAGDVQAALSEFGAAKIVATSGARTLATTRLNQVFENQSADQVISDMANQAGVLVGRVDASITYPYLVIDETRSVFDCIKSLAAREGMECYFNCDNELTVESFGKTRPDHELLYGVHILDLETFASRPGTDHTRVYTESPASTQGQDTWHWIAKDNSNFQGAAGSGSGLLTMSDGAVRTKDAADQLSANKYGAITDHASGGRLRILGNPAIKLVDAIEIKNVPDLEMNGLFKVTGIEHRLNKIEGFVSFVDFTGHGNAAAATGALGDLGSLAGAVGF